MPSPFEFVSKAIVGRNSKFGLTHIKATVDIHNAIFGKDWSLAYSQRIINHFKEDIALSDFVGIRLQYMNEEVHIPFKQISQITPQLIHNHLNSLFENQIVCGTLAISVTTVKIPTEYLFGVS